MVTKANNKNLRFLYVSLLFFAIALAMGFGIAGQVENLDRYRWLLLTPLPFSLAGVLFSLLGILRAMSYWKVTCLLTLIANLSVAIITFGAYAFSYWQF